MKKSLVWIGLFTLILSLSATLFTGCAKTSALKKEAVVTREPTAVVPVPAEAATGDRDARGKALQEQALREQNLKEQALREQTLKEQSAKDAAAKAARDAADRSRRDAAEPVPKELQIPDIYFEFDRFNLNPEAQKTLKEGAVAYLKYKEYRLVVEGHADERGAVEYNLALGDKRAAEVAKYLVGLGIERERIKTISYGKEMPQDRGHNEAAWAKNRRVHFVVSPPTGR